MPGQICRAYEKFAVSYANRLSPESVSIFLCHGVVDGYRHRIRNYNRKHIHIDMFAGIMRELRAAGNAVSMNDVFEAAHGRIKLPPRAFAVTFDDGFANNLDVAAPILSDLKIPATFYLTTDFVDRNSMSWVDRIEWVLEEVARGRLRLPWGERSFTSDGERIGLLDEIRGRVKWDRDCDAEVLADDIARQLGFSPVVSSDDPLDRKLTWAELAQLAAYDGFTLGGHSHTHKILAFLDDDALESEIGTSIRMLHDRAGLVCRHYSYPEGLSHCYSDRVISTLKRHGIVCCPTAEDGINTMPTDPFRLKRIFVT